MAYTNGNVRRDEITRVVCDACAEAGEVPFETKVMPWSGGTERFQRRPWCWYPTYGGPCDKCGKGC